MTGKVPEKLPFTKLGRYEVRAKIAEGGMAILYLGRGGGGGGDAARSMVALKVIRPEYARDLQFVAMFLDEAKLTSRLDHPSIVKIHEQASQDGKLFIAMELLFGQSLATVWEASDKRGPRLPPEVVAFVGARVADGLHHAHELKDEAGVAQDVVHRDINPSNIFVTYGGHVKIIDFGLAKAVDRLTSTMAGVVKGKLAYMSPEQIAGPSIDRRTDIFALGTTLWELTVGRRLFKAPNDAETMRNVREARVPDPRSLVPSFPPALAEILMRALARDRDARYPTAAELAKDLDAFVMTGGRIVNPATLLDLMTNLFPGERDRDASWFEDGELPIRTVPLAPISLPSMELVSDVTHLPTSPDPISGAAPATLLGRPSVSLAAPTVRYPQESSQESSQAPPEPVEASGYDLHDPKDSPIEPSTGEGPAGVPGGALGLLSAGEIAMFAALGLLVAAAIAAAIFAAGR
jgi:eukaryotic-like serine/threonine-protein kinase